MLGSGEGTSSAQAGWTLGMGLDLKGGLIRKECPTAEAVGLCRVLVLKKMFIIYYLKTY